ncbi:MAG: anhydro-N-acetylmuramic acid kinase [Pleurocapsa sp.]
MKVIGLISGTSVDGIDTALVEITGEELDLQIQLLAGATYPYPQQLKEQIVAVCGGKALTMTELASLDDAIALNFAQAARQIQQPNFQAELIGSHGQTIYHRSPQETANEIKLGYSLQIGRGEIIAHATNITTVSNFRAADLAAGGEGAPLVSKIDACLLAHPTKYRAIQNLGGIGNVTYLPPKNQADWLQQASGWDTGPGNILLDLAVQQLTNGNQMYDADGRIAAQGTPNLDLVNQWLKQDFFQSPPPKSTGRELFSPEYLAQCQQDADKIGLNKFDFLATLTELTVASIIHSYRNFLPQLPDEILLCGGGSHNLYLRQRLQAELTSAQIITTDNVGLNGDFKEAIAFAVLAYWRHHGIAGNLPQVTGASQPVLLGEIHLPFSSQA